MGRADCRTDLRQRQQQRPRPVKVEVPTPATTIPGALQRPPHRITAVTMDGIIIERSVTVGQTVAASFQAPTLFTIGDLRAVSIEIALDEADIAISGAASKPNSQ